MRNRKSLMLVLLAILGGWAIVLRMIDFPILPAAPFLKVDFSDLMVLIGLLVNGPIGAVSVALIRDLANYFMKGGEVGLPIGVMMSFIASMAMFLPTHFIMKKTKGQLKMTHRLLLSVTLVLALTISMSLFNYYIALPIYVNVMNFPIDNIANYLLTVIVPFNFIKGLILSVGQLIVVEKLLPMIEKRQLAFNQYRPLKA